MVARLRVTRRGGTPARGAGPDPATARLAGRQAGRARTAAVAAGIAVLLAAAATTSGFFTIGSLRAILSSASIVGILAVGETVIMIGGSLFSLSLATTSAVAAMCFVETMRYGLPVAAVTAVAVGIAANAVQGVAVGRWRANPIIVTIAAGSLATGIAAWLTGDTDLTPPAAATGYLGLARPLGGIPASVYMFAGLALAAELTLRRTRFGLELYLVGDNRQAARSAALPVAALTTAAFAVAGLCAGAAGVLLVAVNHNASLSLAGNNTYNAVTAVLVGGTAVTGGSGSVTRTVCGALAVSAITDIAVLRGYSSGVQILAEGVLVLVAVVLARLGRR